MFDDRLKGERSRLAGLAKLRTGYRNENHNVIVFKPGNIVHTKYQYAELTG